MDVAFLTIAELQPLYDRHELSSVEVVRALFRRISRHRSYAEEAAYTFLPVCLATGGEPP